jgi:pentatricopeptide repeat protein
MTAQAFTLQERGAPLGGNRVQSSLHAAGDGRGRGDGLAPAHTRLSESLSLPGTEVAPEAQKYNDALLAFAKNGEWKKALVLLTNMRNCKLQPSVEAYARLVNSLRLQLRFQESEALLAEMFRSCMPQEDLIAKYAAASPEEDGCLRTQQVFALLQTMREDDLEPNEDTYRAVMTLAGKEKLWCLGLMLADYATRKGPPPDKFFYDALCAALDAADQRGLADMFYERAEDQGHYRAWIADGSENKIDLHNFTSSMARAAVRSALYNMIRKPAERFHHNPAEPLRIVTGMGKHSEDGVAVIKPIIISLLKDELKIQAEVQSNNKGVVEVKSHALKSWIKLQHEEDAA